MYKIYVFIFAVFTLNIAIAQNWERLNPDTVAVAFGV